MSRQSKNAKKQIIAKQVTVQHLSGVAAGKIVDPGKGKNAAKRKSKIV